MRPVVADTGPLNYLILIEAVDVFPRLFSPVGVTSDIDERLHGYHRVPRVNNSGLVRIGRREALPVAGAGFGYTVVQERAEEPVDSDRCARRRGETSSRSYHGCRRSLVRGREIPRKIRGQ